MINDGINDVPNNTIAIFFSSAANSKDLTPERVFNMVKPSSKKREWFTPHFYRCLPLTIGNQYGFTISSEWDFGFEWNGGDRPEDTLLFYDPKVNDENNIVYPRIETHFGHGIITVNPPFTFRTPPGTNLMTINPPNFIIPNITAMTGVIETDNIRNSFTFNLKIQIPNIKVFIPAGTPIAAFIPVPRYYCDNFSLKFAKDVFDQNIIDEEVRASKDFSDFRKNKKSKLENNINRFYMTGKDVYGNVFKDHQKP